MQPSSNLFHRDSNQYTLSPLQPPGARVSNQLFGAEKPLIWLVARRWRGLIALSTLAGLLLACVVTQLQTPRYRSRATIEIEDLNDNFLNTKQVIPVNDGMASNVFSDVQTQIQLLQSNALLDRVYAALSAVRVQHRGPDRAEYNNEALLQVRRSLNARAIGQTRIIELTSESTDSNLAAAYLNQLCTDVIDRNIASRLEASQNIGEWLSRLVHGAQTTLRSSEAALQEYARTHGLIFTQANKSAAEESFRQLQDELTKAKALRIDKESQYETVKSNSVLPISSLLDNSVQQCQQRLDDLRRQRSELAVIYKPDYTRIRQLDAEIDSVESALKREQQTLLDRVQNDYEQARRRQLLLAAEFARQVQQMSDVGQRSIEYSMLQHEVDSNRQLYDSMLQRVKEATIASAVQPSKIRIVDTAVPPRSPFYPKRLLNCLSGAVVFSFGSLLFAFARERFDSTLKDPGDAMMCLQMPELGAVPHVYRKWAGKKQITTLLSKSPNENRAGLIADSFSSIATSILFSGATDECTHVIVVTSAGPHEGKTTIVKNLGSAFARSRRRVLLVDGDLRCRRLAQAFGVSNEVGLATILAGESPDYLKRLPGGFIQGTSDQRVFVVPSGPTGSYSPDLLYSANLPRVVELLKKDFDIILIDTPPVLDMPDARLFARVADGVIFVTRSRRTTVEAACAALQRLSFDRTRLLGIVLNDWNAKESSRGYSGTYVLTGYQTRNLSRTI
jgi:polysaccharide biosynthesis transport protein